MTKEGQTQVVSDVRLKKLEERALLFREVGDDDLRVGTEELLALVREIMDRRKHACPDEEILRRARQRADRWGYDG